MSRPELNEKISKDDFVSFYWLKEELIAFCRMHGIKTTGGKAEIARKIEDFLTTGTLPLSVKPAYKSASSSFDWNTAALTPETVITTDYRNTENVRNFMVANAGRSFRFTVDFMKWLKENPGKTLFDALEEWRRQNALKKQKRHITEIGPQFEYNRYLRAFLADNPTMTTQDAIRFWKLKKALRGNREYAKSDLALVGC
jgi:hypothetical protein